MAMEAEEFAGYFAAIFTAQEGIAFIAQEFSALDVGTSVATVGLSD